MSGVPATTARIVELVYRLAGRRGIGCQELARLLGPPPSSAGWDFEIAEAAFYGLIVVSGGRAYRAVSPSGNRTAT